MDDVGPSFPLLLGPGLYKERLLNLFGEELSGDGIPQSIRDAAKAQQKGTSSPKT